MLVEELLLMYLYHNIEGMIHMFSIAKKKPLFA